MEAHVPPSTSYLLGYIHRNEQGELAFESLRFAMAPFPARLFALEVENQTQDRATLDIELELKRRSTGTVLRTPSFVVRWGEYEDPANPSDMRHYGGWVFVPAGRWIVTIYVANDWVASEDVEVVGDIVEIRPNGSTRAQSREGDRVYCQGHVVRIENQSPSTYYAYDDQGDRVEGFSVDGGSEQVPTVADLVLPTDVTSFRLSASSTGAGTGTLYSVYDVDGDTVELFEAGGKIVSAPYAITPKDGRVRVHNKSSSSVDVWQEGNRDGTKPVPDPEHPDDPVVFTVPFEDHQPSLHWDTGGDPKVIIRQDDRGGGTRDGDEA